MEADLRALSLIDSTVLLEQLLGADWQTLPDLEYRAREAGIDGDDLIGVLEYASGLVAPANGNSTALPVKQTAAAEAAQVPDSAEGEPTGRGRPSQATVLVNLAGDVDVFHTAAQEAYAAIDVDGHRETWPLRSAAFMSFLRRRYYHCTDKAPGGQAVTDALGVLEGKALFEGDEREMHVRLAEHAGDVYLDLADPLWRAVRISRDGWSIVDAPPVWFRRPRGMLPLPDPVAGGSVDDLRPFVNVAAADWHLVVAWLVGALRPKGPYPLLNLNGEQGSAKSSTARALRAVVDPNELPLRAQPKEERDLMIAARNSWTVVFDNLSHVKAEMSDALCRLSTGGGISTRQLYTDGDEVLLGAQRPVILNGIDDVVSRADLLDRSIVVQLPRLDESSYRTETDLWSAFDAARPGILGALLTAVSGALSRVDEIHLERLPRMADFATWITAAEPSLVWPDGTFLQAYSGNRAEARELLLEASPLAAPVREISSNGFLGTASDLLKQLETLVDEDIRHSKPWPGNARALSAALGRLAPILRGTGTTIEFKQIVGNSTRGIRLSTDAKDANAPPTYANENDLRTHETPQTIPETTPTYANDAKEPSSTLFHKEEEKA